MELDDAYANAAHIAGAADYPPLWAERAKAYRDRLAGAGRAKLAVPYGDRPREVFDLFLPKAAHKGVCVFVHGGYWLRFDNSYWSHLAAGPLAHGWAVAMPSYDLCPDVQIADITRQIARAISEATRQIAGPLALAGHSAGGHLVARMGVPGVLPSQVAQRVQSIVPISPVADLRPMLKTSMNVQFGLDMAAAKAESPVLMTPMDVPVTVWVGGEERPVFLDQAQWLAKAWGCGHVVAEGKHHFDVIDALADPDSAMVAALIG
ncbi:alpha/beta hydrolase fold domain-containing protein [Roseovarius gahaiensis]|uniref:Alpha/beta hydrolase fold domain-containing protein n=1 Tax=Roseovarius gahaiensis TaxID=2716691 RepID=A0A967EK53_9RHOB|nr:alpha/beta hydrolase [Roseovarius gahaiensis]NHQ73714.1 alpha/beta hydrolase fold domain-containing protein [Roseovarius gahaiensis]